MNPLASPLNPTQNRKDKTMCLIAVTPRRDLVPLDHLRNAQTRNADGWGIMYAADGRVHVARGMGGHNEFLDAWSRVPEDMPCAVHFRYATKGAKTEANCHPFKVHFTGRHELYVMHNGPRAMDCNGNKERSDTAELAADVLRPMLQDHPRLIRLASYQRLLANAMGSEKLVFLEGCGKWHIINEQNGTRDKATGVWYSNAYSIEERKVYTPSHHSGGTYYQGGVYAPGYFNDWDAFDADKKQGKQGELLRDAICPLRNHKPCLRGCVPGQDCKEDKDPTPKVSKKDAKKNLSLVPQITKEATPHLHALISASAMGVTVNLPSSTSTRDAKADQLLRDKLAVNCKRAWCNCTDPKSQCDGIETQKLLERFPKVNAGLERSLTWKLENVALLSGSELLELVQLDAEGAADFIREHASNKTIKASGKELLTYVQREVEAAADIIGALCHNAAWKE